MLQWLPHTGGESTPHLVVMQFFLLSQGVKKTLRLIGQEEAVSQNIKPRNKREIATRIMAAAAGNSARAASREKEPLYEPIGSGLIRELGHQPLHSVLSDRHQTA